MKFFTRVSNEVPNFPFFGTYFQVAIFSRVGVPREPPPHLGFVIMHKIPGNPLLQKCENIFLHKTGGP